MHFLPNFLDPQNFTFVLENNLIWSNALVSVKEFNTECTDNVFNKYDVVHYVFIRFSHTIPKNGQKNSQKFKNTDTPLKSHSPFN